MRRLGAWTPGESSLTEPMARQRRVSAYLKLLCVLFGSFWCLDTLQFAWRGATSRLVELGHVMQGVFALGVLLCSVLLRARERSAQLIANLESAATLGLGLVSLAILHTAPREQTPVGPLMGLALTLVARAALVPSSVWRTLGVGAGVTALGAASYGLSPFHAQLSGFAGVWLLAFTLVSAFVARVIYGLQDQVREARQLGQYVLEQRLGEGGMGVVYRAQHAMLRRPTAVKVMSSQLSDERHLARFTREVQQTARLTHPNTVTVYDYGRTREGVFYYAMELLDGANLEEVVNVSGILPEARVVSILDGVAGALAEAHGILLVHRDIKPSNVMLCDQGGIPDTPKVLDFGLVRDLQTNHGVTEAGGIAGSPAFMSPEAIRAPDTVGPASDLYALGAVGYYLLTAQHVFDGQTILEVCSHHLLTPPVPPSERRGVALHPELELLIMRCLEKDAAQRPASASEFQSALRALELAPDWRAVDARRWWQTHRPTIELRRKVAQRDRAGSSLTLQVDRAGRY